MGSLVLIEVDMQKLAISPVASTIFAVVIGLVPGCQSSLDSQSNRRTSACTSESVGETSECQSEEIAAGEQPSAGETPTPLSPADKELGASLQADVTRLVEAVQNESDEGELTTDFGKQVEDLKKAIQGLTDEKTKTTLLTQILTIEAALKLLAKNSSTGGATGGSDAYAPTVVFAGTPSSPSVATTLNVSLSGALLYKHVLVAGTASCASVTGIYPTDWQPITTNIVDAIGGDGTKKLCVIGKTGAYVQSLASEYAWTKDTTPPATFSITAPAAATNSATPTLTWQVSAGADSYDVKLATDSGCSTVVRSWNALTTNAAIPPILASNTYYVCVQAKDQAGNIVAASNQPWSFEIDASGPNTPAAPTDAGAWTKASSTTFDWASVTDHGGAAVAAYKIRIGTSPGDDDVYSGQVSNATSYTRSGLASGTTYFAQVQAVDAVGNTSPWSASSDGITVDHVAPAATWSLSTASDAANGPDVHLDDDTAGIFFHWSGAADALSGVASYTLKWYAQADCAGTPTTATGIDDPFYELTSVSSNTTYSFKVAALDNANNSTVDSPCSGNLRVDATPPPNMAAFSGDVGTQDGHIALSLQFPADTSDYASVTIRRATGATPPADCSSDTLIATVGSYVTQTFDDAAGSPGAFFSYRLCIVDVAGNVNDLATAANVQAKARAHTIFVTSGTWTANLGGVSGANAKCQLAATNAGLGGTFQALLSDGSTAANARILLKGPVNLVNGTQVSASRTDFWNNVYSAAVNLDEYGAAGTGSTGVWTGSTAAGGNGAHCASWTDGSGTGGSAAIGMRNSTSSTLLYSNTPLCSGVHHIYCISIYTGSPLVAFAGATGTNLDGDVSLNWTYPTDMTGFGRLDIRRAAGTTVPTCGTGTLVSSITDGVTTSYVDSLPSPGQFYSYLGCVYDVDGDFVSSHPAGAIPAKGARYRIFLTSTTYTGNLGGLAGADAACQARADSASLGGNWMAFLSTASVNAADRMVLDGPIYNLQNQLVATDELDLLNGTISNAAYYTEANVAWTASAWTGSYSSGAKKSHCGDWSSDSATSSGTYGSTHRTSSGWFLNDGDKTCDGTAALWCISHTYYPPIASLSGASGAASGSIELAVAFPGDTSLYGKVELRRKAGNTAPNADCLSDGSVAVTINSNFVNQTANDSGAGSPGYPFSYRACVYDANDRLVDSSMTATKVHSKGTWHRIFTTSSTYTGDLGGLSGADATCTSVANGAGHAGSFKALLSSSTVNLRDRITINGPVYNALDQLVVTSNNDLFDNTIAANIYYDELGVSAGNAFIWSGSYLNGTKKSNVCSDWASTATNGDTGYPGSVTGSVIESGWGATSCASALKLSCISQ